MPRIIGDDGNRKSKSCVDGVPRRIVRFEHGAYDESLRRRADVAEGIARHECKRRIRCLIEHPHVLWLHDGSALHVVLEDPILGRHANVIVGIDVAQLAEERVAMPGQADVAVLTRQRGPGDVADREPERARIASGANHRGDAEPWNFDAANRRTGRRWRSAGHRRRSLFWRSTLQDRVELLIFEGLIEPRFAVHVNGVTETHHTCGNKEALEPAARARPPAAWLLERTVEVLDEPEASPTPCSHCEL
jgi:hypothetical protein